MLDTSHTDRYVCAKETLQFTDEEVYFIPLNQDATLCIACDKMGMRKNLDINFKFNTVAAYYPVANIMGDVVFLRCKKELNELEDLTECDINYISYILRQENQQILKTTYDEWIANPQNGCHKVDRMID